MIAIVDYGAANLLSISRALEAAEANAQVTGDPDEIIAADAVVLPGVGAAGSAMARLRGAGADEALRAIAVRGTPLLGLCLGMQLFFDWLAEDDVAGLGLLSGRVEELPPDGKVPHMGWNNLDWTPLAAGGELFAGLCPGAYVYFVHSYHCLPDDPGQVVARTDYAGQPIVAAIASGNIRGLQFHPEKSGPAGMAILRNWVRRVQPYAPIPQKEQP
ncbi:MAG TPA: imidazole glycerol phosphate synthase subunit HisH [Thermomicrobiaceae bacterium]|nr:imidazole glycerol phosphate synthase subunit HisH [Thermomicrobiaceae bacterium]